jgi:hypothetical protein
MLYKEIIISKGFQGLATIADIKRIANLQIPSIELPAEKKFINIPSTSVSQIDFWQHYITIFINFAAFK